MSAEITKTKYTFRFKDRKIVVGRASYETEFHVYAKALVFALFYKDYPTIAVEAKCDDRFQPDLSAIGYDGTMRFWAECGTVSFTKIEKLFKKYRQAHYVFVKEERDVPIFEKNMQRYLKDMRTLPLVDIVIYPEHFHEWNVSQDGDVFIRREDVNIIRWHKPPGHSEHY